VLISVFQLLRKKNLSLAFILLLGIPLYLHLFFIIGEYWIFQLLLVPVIILVVFLMYKNRKNLILISVLLFTFFICILTSEWLNGISTFEDKRKFFELRSKIGGYYEYPYKIYQKDNKIYVFSFETGNKKYNLVGFEDLYRTEIKIEDDKVYYLRRKRNKHGQLPDAKWFEYGKEQVWGGA
jgi:hypothetical protein